MAAPTTRVEIAAGSAEFFYVDNIDAFDLNSPDYGDPTDISSTVTIKFAFTEPGVDADGGSDWMNGEWAAWTPEDGASARVMLDIPGAPLGWVKGDKFDTWVWIQGAVEKPMRKIPPGIKVV